MYATTEIKQKLIYLFLENLITIRYYLQVNGLSICITSSLICIVLIYGFIIFIQRICAAGNYYLSRYLHESGTYDSVKV